MQFIKSFFILVILGFFTSATFAQLDSVYYLSGSGIVDNGATQTTDNFTAEPIPIPAGEFKVIPIRIGTNTEPMFIPGIESETLPPFVYVEDSNAAENPQVQNGQTVLLQKFPGIPMTNFIPPDPTMAVGPNHVIACVNDQFSIWDKQGNLLKVIPANTWWAPISPFESGDPQVIYDHFMHRWVLVWLEGGGNPPQYGDLVAYSDDDDPLGTWYLYRFPNTTLGDYPKLGFDDEALYVMTRQGPWTFIRIIDKAELYSSNGGSVNYSFLYNIRTPGGGPSSAALDVINPAISYTPGSGAWFFWARGSFGSAPIPTNFYALYKITNPLTNPGISGKVLNVPTYYTPPFGGQLGGGMGLETIGWMSRAPVVRDGYLYAAHDVANSTNNSYSSVKYLKVDLSTPSMIENVEFGNLGYYYLYPALTVDKDHNIAITFSRSATTEYVGGYYSTKLAADPPGLSPSQPLAEGQGNYVVDFGAGRNRWGDYMGIYLDPSNEYDVWLFPEYAAATNVWGTMVGQIRMVPFSGVFAHTLTPVIEYGNIEVSTTSDTITAILANYGDQDLVIDVIPSSMGDFNLDVTGITFPVTLQSYDSLTLKFSFSPTVPDSVEETFLVTSNDPAFTGFTLSGHGYVINPAVDKVLYASSGPQNNGNLLSLNTQTGVGTNIGSLLFTDISGLTISPLNDELLGVNSATNESQILRVNSLGGDAYLLHNLNLGGIVSIAFDTSGNLYGALESGEIYSIDLTNGTYQLVSTALIELTAITFDPMTNDLWATIQGGFGVDKDQIFKIELLTGDTTLVGLTGFNTLTNGLAFDENGVLYGIKGSGPNVSDLFTIDVNTGEGTIVGSVGLMALTDLAFAETGFIVSVDGSDDKTIPTDFTLSQNYPNPFNPSTSIEFSLPVNSNVTLTIYNLLGQVVTTLVNEDKPAGAYSVEFNATSLPSGIYFYKLEAGTFIQTKKMVLLK